MARPRRDLREEALGDRRNSIIGGGLLRYRLRETRSSILVAVVLLNEAERPDAVPFAPAIRL